MKLSAVVYCKSFQRQSPFCGVLDNADALENVPFPVFKLNVISDVPFKSIFPLASDIEISI